MKYRAAFAIWGAVAIMTVAAILSWPAQIAEAQSVNPCQSVLCTTRIKYLSAASNNATSVKATQTALYGLVLANTTTTTYFFKAYDKASAPTCGTDTPVMTIPVPATPAAGPADTIVLSGAPIGFNLGLGFCLVAALADNDNTNAATGVVMNLIYR